MAEKGGYDRDALRLDGAVGLLENLVEDLSIAAGYVHEDELPSGISQEDYDKWYAQSWVPDGVGCRVGPPLSIAITAPTEAAIPATVYHCSCGAACTADEYIDHYLEKGHDQGVKAAPASSNDLIAEARAFNTEIANCGINPQKAHELIKALVGEVERLNNKRVAGGK